MNLQQLVSNTSSLAWKVFLPIFIILTLIITYRLVKTVLKATTVKEQFKFTDTLGPLAISLGSMVGTGAVIGVLGAINRLPNGVAPEAIALWSVIGLIIMLPLIYAEVITSKVMKLVPNDYIATILGPNFSKIYIISFFLLYIFGFDGLQYSGIASAIGVVSIRQFGITLTAAQLFIYTALPVFIIVSAIILTKKHNVFIKSLGAIIVAAVLSYVLLLLVFTATTSSYLPIYLSNLGAELTNKTAIVSGLPIGLLLGLQRIIQTSELGIGSISMAASEADTKPRFAASAALIPVVITVVISIIGTSYITSYAMSVSNLTVGNIELVDLLNVVDLKLGTIGVYVFIIFMILSGLSTLIGSFYYCEKIINKGSNINIAAFMIVTFFASALAIFGFSLIFDLIDLLMFLVVSINLVAITKFMFVDYKNYKL